MYDSMWWANALFLSFRGMHVYACLQAAGALTCACGDTNAQAAAGATAEGPVRGSFQRQMMRQRMQLWQHWSLTFPRTFWQGRHMPVGHMRVHCSTMSCI